jgi:Iodothyronine deiodinase
MDDPFEAAFAAWPDRIYVLDAAGAVAYKGATGPRGFKVADVPPVLQNLLGEKN